MPSIVSATRDIKNFPYSFVSPYQNSGKPVMYSSITINFLNSSNCVPCVVCGTPATISNLINEQQDRYREYNQSFDRVNLPSVGSGGGGGGGIPPAPMTDPQFSDCTSLLNWYKEKPVPSPIGYAPLQFASDGTSERPATDTPPQENWNRDQGVRNGRRGSCVRFVIVCVDAFGNIWTQPAGGTPENGCGTTCNNGDLSSIVLQNISPNLLLSPGCYIVAVVFYGWVEPVLNPATGKTKRTWRGCDDSAFSIHIGELIQT
jgi:hypothetical protein